MGGLFSPIKDPSSLVHSSTPGRKGFPRATDVSIDLALDLVSLDAPILQPIITPITTSDEILGPDKSRVQPFFGSKQATAASIKSTRILSKFWGDEQDTDSTVDIEPEIDSQQPSLEQLSQLLATAYGKKGKRGRPKKQKSPNKEGDTPAQSQDNSKVFISELIHTRSKTGSQTHKHNIVSQ